VITGPSQPAVDHQGPAAPLSREAIAFGPRPGLFGWYHPAPGLPRTCVVVLCQPLHYENICAHRSFRKLAERLALAGFPCLRFDYAGTGDSPGDDQEPDRVRGWLDSVQAAVAEVKTRSGAVEVACIGVRMGALLASVAAAELGGVDSLVLFAPVSGRGYVREVTAFNASREQPSAPAGAQRFEGEETAGFLLTPQTMADLSKLSMRRLPDSPARRALVLLRDDLSKAEAVGESLAARGVQVQERTVPGYARMMAYPHLSVVPTEAWDAAIEFLASAHPSFVDAPRSSPPARPATFALRSASGAFELREEALRFSRDRLFGILAETGSPGTSPAAERTCVLLPTMASHHRIGPNRLHVRWARELADLGLATLRFDVSGTGDSEVNQTGQENAPYALDQLADLSAAIDLLQTRGYSRFLAIGFCSGAYLAWNAAIRDPRLRGIILINIGTFEWKPGDQVKTGSTSRVAQFKSTRSYRRALFQLRTWKRLAGGEIQVGRLFREFARRLRERASKTFGKNDVLHNLQELSEQGVTALLLCGSEDMSLDLVESYLGPAAARLRRFPNARLQVVEGAEHTFGQMWAQQLIKEIIAHHLTTSGA